ncbi:MAG TPA: hypothetical protein VFR63_14495 [Gaiellaceae bacterium]|nr:hypothetical protein [Gaiellaceae bacterium]
MLFGHHMGEEALAAALVSGGAALPMALLVLRARLDRLGRRLRRRRPR